jgi:hypothetical protein
MTAQGRYAVDLDAAYLGNGCSPMHETATRVGPLANTNPSGFIPAPP